MTPLAQSFLDRYPHPETEPQEFCREFNRLDQVDRDACLTHLIEQASKATVNEETRGDSHVRFPRARPGLVVRDRR